MTEIPEVKPMVELKQTKPGYAYLHICGHLISPVPLIMEMDDECYKVLQEQLKLKKAPDFEKTGFYYKDIISAQQFNIAPAKELYNDWNKRFVQYEGKNVSPDYKRFLSEISAFSTAAIILPTEETEKVVVLDVSKLEKILLEKELVEKFRVSFTGKMIASSRRHYRSTGELVLAKTMKDFFKDNGLKIKDFEVKGK